MRQAWGVSPHRDPAARAGFLPDGCRYWAFVSYSYADAAWARWIHHALETYPIPANLVGRSAPTGTVPPRIKPVFRDRDELPAAAELGPQLEAALRDSVALVVLCSPHSAKSRWVNEEILFFKRLGRGARVFPFIVDGVPGDRGGRECFPPGVRAVVNADGTIASLELEPLAADAQPKKDGKALALLKVIAGITGLPLDELRQREQQRRQKRLAIAASAGLALTATMTVLAAVAWQQRQAARSSERRALVSEDLAKQEATRATAAEKAAVDEATRATAAEAVAVKEREATRRALAEAQMELAEAAFHNVELPAMVQALDAVPDDLRTQRWNYLSARRDASVGSLNVQARGGIVAAAAVPGAAGKFALMGAEGQLVVVDAFLGTVSVRAATGLSRRPTLAVSADGKQIAVAAKNAAELRLIRTADGTGEKVLPAPSLQVQRLVYSPDGASLALMDDGDEQSRLWLIDARDGAVRWSQPGVFTDVVFSPDGRRLFTGIKRTRKFMTLAAGSGETIQVRNALVYCLARSHDGERLAVGLYDGEVEIIDIATGEIIRRARLHTGKVERVAWTARDHLLTVGGEGFYDSGRHVMRLWDAANLTARGTFFGLKNGFVPEESALEPQSGFLLTIGQPLRLWRITADLEAARITSAAEQGYAACFLDENVMVARKEWALASYDVSDPRAPKEITGRGGPSGYSAVALHRRAQLLALAAQTNPKPPHHLQIYSVAGSSQTLQREIALDAHVARLDFDPAAERILAVSARDGSTLVYEVKSGAPLLKLPKAGRAVFNAAGDRIIALIPGKRTASDEGDTLTIFDAKSGAALKSVRHVHRLNELVASPDRRHIAIGGAEKIVRILAADTLEEQWSFRALDAEITALAFHPVRKEILSASADSTAKLWDYETARLRGTLLGFDGTPVMAAFSPNGRLLAVESQERGMRLFEADRIFEPPVPSVTAAEVPPETDGWQDLIGALNRAEVTSRGGGWRLDRGALIAPTTPFASLSLPGNAVNASYQLRLKVRQFDGQRGLHFRLPVGRRMVSFELDSLHSGVFHTILGKNDGRLGREGNGVTIGEKVRDSTAHALELTFRLEGADAHFTATLDGATVCTWSGPIASLGANVYWTVVPGVITIGTNGTSWEVSELKLRRL